MPPGTKNAPPTSFSFVLALLSALFQLSWLEVLSGATVLPVTVTGLNYRVQTSTQHLDRHRHTQLIYHTDPLIKKMN